VLAGAGEVGMRKDSLLAKVAAQSGACNMQRGVLVARVAVAALEAASLAVEVEMSVGGVFEPRLVAQSCAASWLAPSYSLVDGGGAQGTLTPQGKWPAYDGRCFVVSRWRRACGDAEHVPLRIAATVMAHPMQVVAHWRAVPAGGSSGAAADAAPSCSAAVSLTVSHEHTGLDAPIPADTGGGWGEAMEEEWQPDELATLVDECAAAVVLLLRGAGPQTTQPPAAAPPPLTAAPASLAAAVTVLAPLVDWPAMGARSGLQRGQAIAELFARTGGDDANRDLRLRANILEALHRAPRPLCAPVPGAAGAAAVAVAAAVGVHVDAATGRPVLEAAQEPDPSAAALQTRLMILYSTPDAEYCQTIGDRMLEGFGSSECSYATAALLCAGWLSIRQPVGDQPPGYPPSYVPSAAPPGAAAAGRSSASAAAASTPRYHTRLDGAASDAAVAVLGTLPRVALEVLAGAGEVGMSKDSLLAKVAVQSGACSRQRGVLVARVAVAALEAASLAVEVEMSVGGVFEPRLVVQTCAACWLAPSYSLVDGGGAQGPLTPQGKRPEYDGRCFVVSRGRRAGGDAEHVPLPESSAASPAITPAESMQSGLAQMVI